MGAFTLKPTADGTYTAWSASAGADWQCLSDGNDATYISTVTAGARTTCVLADLPAEANIIVGSITVSARGKDVSATADKVYSTFRYGGANYEDPTGWDLNHAAITAYTRIWATGPGGATWSPTILNACELGVYRAGSTYTTNIYLLECSGEWAAVAGNFAYLVCSLVGGMLGSQLMLSDMPAIAREVWNNPRPGEAQVIFLPHEYDQVFRELKEHPFRKVIDLGEHRFGQHVKDHRTLGSGTSRVQSPRMRPRAVAA